MTTAGESGPLRAGDAGTQPGPDDGSAEQLRRDDALAGAERILEVRDLVKEFPVLSGAVFRRQVGSVKAVSGVTFDIRKGETFGLVGESGCGKTTVGRLVVSLDQATAGSIRFEGDRAFDAGRRRAAQPPSGPAAHVPGPLRRHSTPGCGSAPSSASR